MVTPPFSQTFQQVMLLADANLEVFTLASMSPEWNYFTIIATRFILHRCIVDVHFNSIPGQKPTTLLTCPRFHPVKVWRSDVGSDETFRAESLFGAFHIRYNDYVYSLFVLHVPLLFPIPPRCHSRLLPATILSGQEAALLCALRSFLQAFHQD